MDVNRLRGKAKQMLDKRGGTEGLKADAERLKGIAKGPGTLGDKAKRAADAVKQPPSGGSGGR